MNISKRKNLMKFRIDHDLTQAQLGEKLGVTVGYVNQIELGKKKPTIELLLKFKNVFSIETMDEVMKIFEMI